MSTHHPHGPSRRLAAVTGRQVLFLVALGALAGSASFWWEIERTLTPTAGVAAAYTIILTLAPSTLMSTLLPWSPAGRLLARLRTRTWGTGVVTLSALILVWSAVERQAAWWALQPVVAASGLTTLQTLIGLIGFVVIPALVWAPTSDDTLLHDLNQAQLVARAAAQTQADLALLRATLLRAQVLAGRGAAAWTPDERAELAQILRGLVGGIATTLDQLASSVSVVTGVRIPQPPLADTPTVQVALERSLAALTADAHPDLAPEDSTPTRSARKRSTPATAAADPAPPTRRRTGSDTKPAEIKEPAPRTRRTAAART
jgi:hypothetical protein